MTVSFKGGVTAITAFFALFGGVQLAHAGIGDVVDEAASVAENALPSPEETQLDDVVEAATATVDATVADPPAAVESVAQQATETVQEATGTVKEVADETLGGKAVERVTKALEPAAVVSAPPARSEAPRSATNDAALTTKTSDRARASSAPAPRPTLARGRKDSIASSASALTHRPSVSALTHRPSASAMTHPSGTPQAHAVWTRPITQILASAPAKPVKASSAAPAVPFAPPPPGDQPATAASVAGAAGAALLAALLSVLFFLALQTGRVARPGPILVRAAPCLSLPERPG